MTDLSGYRWHTGAPLRRPTPGEPLPLLFRDVGTRPLATFLREGLRRLAGPMTPLTYLRTAAFREPYEDHEAIGRLVLLEPAALDPWHAGVPHVYVADARRNAAVGFVPGDCMGEHAPVCLSDVPTGALAEAAARDALRRLDRLHDELERVDRTLEPLRRAFQSRGPTRDEARRTLDRIGLGEAELCAPWHHLSAERRARTVRALA